MKNINYHCSSIIWLSLENYHNAGLTPQQTKEAIEADRTLWCEEQGINHNWNVRTRLTHPLDIQELVEEIQYRLNKLLSEHLFACNK